MNDSDPPKPVRRWYQFSLRTLMVFVLLCAVVCSWVSVTMNRVKRQRQVVAEIRKVDPAAVFVYPYENSRYGQEPWLAKLFGDDFYPVVEVHPSSHIREATLIQLGKLTSLKKLNLNETQVTDAGLEHLKGLTNLQRLGLYDTQVTPASVEKLQQALPGCEIRH